MKASIISRLLLVLVLMIGCLGCSKAKDELLSDIFDGIINTPQKPIYIDQDGTVIARYWAEFGDTTVINGITYTVVNELMLRDLVGNKDDLTKLATTFVTNMSELFSDYPTFNQDIGNWDVKNVTDMSYMFQGVGSFNQDIGNWNVRNVTNMSGMFSVTDAFNQDIGNWWVNNVTDMYSMFRDAASFNQDLSSWSVWNVQWCDYFDYNTPQWILPKPNFTNCTP